MQGESVDIFKSTGHKTRAIELLTYWAAAIREGRADVVDVPREGCAADAGYHRDADVRYLTVMARPSTKQLAKKLQTTTSDTTAPKEVSFEDVVNKQKEKLKCPYCPERFNSPRGLKRHITMSHKGEKELEQRKINS